jgi:hypothetical protein
MSARSASPDHTAPCRHGGCRSPGHRLRRHRQNGPFRSRHHRGAPSRALRPRRDSVASDSLRSARRGRDPSMEGVQPSCQRSAPGIRIDSPRAACTALGWVSRFTPLHPLRPAARPPLRCSLPERRPPDEPLALLVPPRMTGFAATATAEVPRRLPGPPRERCARAFGRGAPSTGEEHPRALPLARCRTSRDARSPFGRSRSTRRLGVGTATTALSLRTPDTARRLLQSTRNPSTPAW